MDTSEPWGPEAWVSLSRSVGGEGCSCLGVGLVHRPVLWTNKATNSGVRKAVSRTKEDSGEPGPASSLFPLLSGRARGGAGEDTGDSVQHEAPAELPGRRLSLLSLAGKGLFTDSA